MPEDEIEKLHEQIRLLQEHIRKNAGKIDRIYLDVQLLREQAERQESEFRPVADFIHDVETVGRVGRVIRAFVGWVALLLGAGAVVWVAVVGPSEK